jgi:diacylglycerol O-acyltransferase
MSRHAMSAADAAWLHMDSRTNPMVVNGLVLLGEVPDPDRMAELLERRLVKRFPRFRQRVVDPLGRRPAFEDDPAFDLRGHLHRLALPAPGDRVGLQAAVGDLIASPLDPSRPLWHAHLIEGYEGGAALLWRMHHCIADGIALARVMLSVSDDAEAAIETIAPHAAQGALSRLAAGPLAGLSVLRRLGGAAVHEASESLAHPDHLRKLAGAALRDTTTTAKLLAGPPDAPSDLRAPLSGARCVSWSEPYPLEGIRKAARRQGATINDLLVAALAGTLHELFESSPRPDGRPEEIHTMVPVNLRPLEEPVPAELGNEFALILLALPVGPLRPAERLRLVSRRMGEIKRSHEAAISYGILSAIGLTPPWVEDRLIGFFTEKASLVVTNVPGPRRRVHFAGAPVEGVMVWAPCSGSLGMTVSIFSYDGEVTVGFMADTALVPDPEPLARAYEGELARLAGEAGRRPADPA